MPDAPYAGSFERSREGRHRQLGFCTIWGLDEACCCTPGKLRLVCKRCNEELGHLRRGDKRWRERQFPHDFAACQKMDEELSSKV